MIDLYYAQFSLRYLFNCDRWLAIDKDDGKVDRMLPVSQLSDLNQGEMLRNNINRKLFEDHIWLSVGVRKTKSHFTRLQRLSVCLSLLFMTMIANAMWYRSDDEGGAVQAISIGPISFTITELYTSIVSSLTVVPPILIVTIFFSKSRSWKSTKRLNDKCTLANRINPTNTAKNCNSLNKETIEGNDEQYMADATNNDAKKQVTNDGPHCSDLDTIVPSTYATDDDDTDDVGRTFHWWCSIIAWVLVALSVGGAAFFTILYSLQWGKEKSTAWLTSFLLSFVQSIILIQPVKVVAIAVILTCIFKKDHDIETYKTPMLETMEDQKPKGIHFSDMANISGISDM